MINDNPNITIIELGKLVNDLIETEMKNLKNAKCFEDLKLGNIEVVNDLMHDFTRWTYHNKLFHSKITPIYFGKILVTILEHRELGKLDQSDVIFTKVLSSMIIIQIWLLFPRLESMRIFCKTHQT